MRAASLLLLAGLTATALAADDDPRALANKLAHPQFAERDTATRQLVALGPPAIPALQSALRTGPPEAVRRAAHAIAAIQLAEDSRQAVAVKTIALDIREKPLAAAVAELRALTGANLALDAKGIADPNRPVTIRVTSTTPWQAVETFRAAAGLMEVDATDVPAAVLGPSVSPDTRYPIRAAVNTRPSDVPVVWLDGTADPRPADSHCGVRVLALPAARDSAKRTVSLTLDVMPTAGLNWARTDEVRIGLAETDDGRKLDPLLQLPVVRTVVAPRTNEWKVPELAVASNGSPTSTRAFTVVLSAPRPVMSLKCVEGVVLGDVHRPNHPLLEVADLAAAVGKTFDGPHGSTLTVDAVKSGVVTVRCSALSPWVVRQKGWARPGEMADVAFGPSVERRVKLYGDDGKEMPTYTRFTGSAATDTRQTTTFMVCWHGDAPPAKLAVLGTKIVPVRVPFRLENVPVK